jgi:GNAT superfamily N-acetyltransferase
MATMAVERRTALSVRTTTDRHLLRDFLERDRLFAAYAICDLEDREFGRTRWGIATEGPEVVAVALEYGGPTPQPMFVMGREDGITAILRDVIRPRIAYVAAMEPSLAAVGRHYRIDPGPQMVRMWVDRTTFAPLTSPVERLLPVEVGELNRLYGLGFSAWIPSAAVAEGVYFGIRVNGRLVAAAGTHVISRQAGLAVVGNVLTHAEHRGRGYAKATTSAVTNELLRYCDHVVLNVRADNPPAIAAYRRLGYQEHCRFEERLVRRSTPAWPDLTAPIRRLFAGWRQAPATAETRFPDQAHPAEPGGPSEAPDPTGTSSEAPDPSNALDLPGAPNPPETLHPSTQPALSPPDADTLPKETP